MHISLNWLNDYVDLAGISPEAIADRLTLSTAEIEGIERRGSELSGVVAARTLDWKRVENSDKLSLLTVDAGGGEPLQVICGAKNARAGITVAFAGIGGSVAGIPKVKKAKLMGVESYGFACSERELGISEDHGGVIELANDIAPGTPLEEIAPDVFDVLFEIDNKSITHRPDLWGHYGFARELAAIFGRELKPLPLIDETALTASDVKIDSVIEDPHNCPRYSSLLFGNARPEPSPLRMKTRLFYAGMRPINLIVDLSNYIMLETGQPTHCFDRDIVKTIRVRTIGMPIKFRTLDDQERDLPPGTLMIYDMDTPIAIGGVMGGHESEIGEKTTGLLLESANFEPFCIRQTANRLGLRTDAAIRYEKSLDPELTMLAVRRFARMLTDIQPGVTIDSRVSDENYAQRDPIKINIAKSYFDAYMGKSLDRAQIVGMLRSLEFDIEESGDELTARVPSFRATKDISIRPDLVEEVARIHGYNSIPPETPTIKLENTEANFSRLAERRLKTLLASKYGFSEVMSYGFYDDDWLKAIGFEPEGAIRLKNPATEHQTRLRTLLLPNLLQAVETNRMNFERFGLFEFGSVFREKNGESREQKRLAALLFSQNRDVDSEKAYAQIKGIAEDLARTAKNLPLRFAADDAPARPWEHPFKKAAVAGGDAVVGSAGYMNPVMAGMFGKKVSCAYFELDFEALMALEEAPIQYREIPKYPEVDLDFTILVPETVTLAEAEKQIGEFSHKLLIDRAFRYKYEGDNLPEGKKSFTFSVRIGSPGGTLERGKIDAFRQQFIQHLEACGFKLP